MTSTTDSFLDSLQGNSMLFCAIYRNKCIQITNNSKAESLSNSKDIVALLPTEIRII